MDGQDSVRPWLYCTGTLARAIMEMDHFFNVKKYLGIIKNVLVKKLNHVEIDMEDILMML